LGITLVACHNHKTQTKHNLLQGSWKMQSVTWMSKGKSYPINPAQAGIFIFTENSYSIQWTPKKEPRVPFVDLSEPTDKEKITGFASVVFNAGSYEYTDNTVTTIAYIAKVPGFEGGIQYYTYKIEVDTLTITMFDESYPDGTKPEWAGKWKTQFVMSRVKR
jgi:hypothetical protein